MRFISPLRYPGGKARLAPYIHRIIEAQPYRPRHYAEPFAGGAGAALKLLLSEHVEVIHLNDLNPGISSMWLSILFHTDEFCEKIMNTPVTIDEWKTQQSIYITPEEHDTFSLGFATFYLNRTNRSGILGARPIGGLEQTGKWKIDARFNKQDLCARIKLISTYRNRINITQQEGITFLHSITHLNRDLFVYADPPYIVQGDGLYLHAFTEENHLALAKYLSSAPYPWILTYDDVPEITDALYSEGRCALFEISHSAHKQHIGKEAIIYSPTLIIPDMDITLGRTAQWVNQSNS